MKKNIKMTTLFFVFSSLIFIVCACFIFFFNPHFQYWHYFFNAFSVLSMISHVVVGYKLDNSDLSEFMLSVSIPSIISCAIWILLALSSFSGGNHGMLGSGVGWIFYYPIVSHSLILLDLLRGVVQTNILFLLPFNFIPILLFLIGNSLKLQRDSR